MRRHPRARDPLHLPVGAALRGRPFFIQTQNRGEVVPPLDPFTIEQSLFEGGAHGGTPLQLL